jgi:hypothetical protein
MKRRNGAFFDSQSKNFALQVKMTGVGVEAV